jgi:hypothetical protein
MKQDRKFTYEYNITVRCGDGNTVAVEKHILGVCVTLGIQHAMHMHHTVFCGLPSSTVFFHIVSKRA